MTQSISLSCRCGKVQGTVSNASPETVNRVVCYCDDCQAFLHHLGRVDLMDAQGGTDIVQVAPASLRFHSGIEHIRGLRLGPKGIYRWYSSCCNTPLGNTTTPSIPFVGIVAQAFGDGPRPARDVLGEPRGAIWGQFAKGTPPKGSTRPSLRIIGRVLRIILGWRLGGKAWPNPFFLTGTKDPAFPVKILSRAERDALRPLCGPGS